MGFENGHLILHMVFRIHFRSHIKSLEVSVDEVPVDNLPELVDISATIVAMVKVIGVLPQVEHDERSHSYVKI